MKKLFCMTLAVLMVLTALPFAAFAADTADAANVKAPGVQSTGTEDARITSKVCSIWRTVDGKEVKYKDYNTLDLAFDGLRDLYVGPLADTTLVDGDDEDNNLNNELYKAAGSPVIKLNGNFNGGYVRPNWATDPTVGTYINYDANKIITIVIDGAKNENENYTIYYGDESNYYDDLSFDHLAFYNLTVKNTNMIINVGTNAPDGIFRWEGNAYRDIDGNPYTVEPGESWTVFENCFIHQDAIADVKINSGGTVTQDYGSGTLFKMNGHKKFDSTVTADPCETDKYNLILKDTTVESGTGVCQQAHWGVDANIKLYNSTMALIGDAGDSSNNNDTLLKFYEAGEGSVYLNATSKLISRRTRAEATTCLIRVLSHQKSPVNIELEKGAELVMANTAPLKNKTYIADGGKNMTTITDNGAIYTVFTTDAKGGVNLPNISGANWLAGSGVAGLVTNNVYKDENATCSVSLTAKGEAPITVKKNGTTVNANAKNIKEAFDFVNQQSDKAAYSIFLNASEEFDPETHALYTVKTVTTNKGTYYNVTLKAAVDALGDLYDAVTTANLTDEALWKAAGSPIIYVYQDATIAEEIYPSWIIDDNLNDDKTPYDANRVRTVIIKGVPKDEKNPHITSTFRGGAFTYNAYYNITLENIDLTCTNGYALYWKGYSKEENAGRSTTNLINCNISATGTRAQGNSRAEGLVFKITGNQKEAEGVKTEDFTFNIVNTNVIAQPGVNAMFLFHHGAAGEVNIDGNSTLHHIMNMQDIGGDTMFMLGTNRKFAVNIESGAKLSADVQVGYNGSYESYAMFRTEKSDRYKSLDGIKNIINIADGVELSITSSTGRFGMPIYFIHQNTVQIGNESRTIINIDDGAIFKVNNQVKSGDFGLYVGQPCNLGDTSNLSEILGTQINNDTSKLYPSEIRGGTINSDVTDMKPIFISSDDFDMLNGAAIRTKNGRGIRFSTYVSNDLLTVLNGKATFGTLIAHNSRLTDSGKSFTLEALGNDSSIAVNIGSNPEKWQESDGKQLFRAALVGFPNTANAFTTQFAARAYMTVTYANGDTATFYTDFNSEDNVRSMYDVAKKLTSDPSGICAYIKNVVENG